MQFVPNSITAADTAENDRLHNFSFSLLSFIQFEVEFQQREREEWN